MRDASGGAIAQTAVFPPPPPGELPAGVLSGVRWEMSSSFTYCLAMPRRTKEAPGRVTPKADTRRQATAGTTVSGRYTAPVPMDYRHSPWWVPASMLTFFAIGLLMIVLNYMSLLPSSPTNWYLLGGLGFIVCGFAVSTQYR
ncbi:MAG: cell division protein CrgA [Acidimicrobiales bacterium]